MVQPAGFLEWWLTLNYLGRHQLRQCHLGREIISPLHLDGYIVFLLYTDSMCWTWTLRISCSLGTVFILFIFLFMSMSISIYRVSFKKRKKISIYRVEIIVLPYMMIIWTNNNFVWIFMIIFPGYKLFMSVCFFMDHQFIACGFGIFRCSV